MKIGYCTWGMPTVPVDTMIPFLARTGYHGVELTVIPGYSIELSTLDQTERKRIAQLLRDHHLELPAIAAHASLTEPDPDKATRNWQQLIDAIELSLDWTLESTPPAIDTTVGSTPADWDARKPLLLDRLGALVRHAEARGVVIALEPHVHTMLDTIPRTLEILRLINSPFLKLNYDISHFNVQGVPIAESVAALAPHTVHTHIKDERGVVPDFEFLIPGEGEFDYVTYLREMDKQGYSGYITAEISIMVQRRPTYDPLAAAEQTYRVMKDAFDKAFEG